jgi:hypothetical protein
MVQTIPAAEVTLHELKQAFGLQQAQDPNFFVEWSETHAALSESEQQLLDRVKANFTELMEDPPMLENSVKMVCWIWRVFITSRFGLRRKLALMWN